jgi:uncharacterized protein DUF3710
VKFRRKAQEEPVDDELVDYIDELGQEDEDADPLADGPLDSEDLSDDDSERVNLGSLLIAPEPDRELRLQVDEASGMVQSVQIVGPDGALELRAFAAPRNGDLWTEVRPQIAAEVAQAGGTATERQGPWGPELILQVGQRGQQQLTRMVGINGPRWMLRCQLVGAAAQKPEESASWEDTIRRVAVHRGAQAMPVGEALQVTMPPQARRVDEPG